MRIQIINLSGAKAPQTTIKKTCLYLLTYFKNNKKLQNALSDDKNYADLVVVLVSKNKSQKLNKLYRKKNYPTDVLSFSAEAKKQGLGELVICMPIIKKQAIEYGHSVKRELETMLIHGFLHLLGYDHEKSLKDEKIMVKIQGRVLNQMQKRLKRS